MIVEFSREFSPKDVGQVEDCGICRLLFRRPSVTALALDVEVLDEENWWIAPRP
jgi:hypothetical protein